MSSYFLTIQCLLTLSFICAREYYSPIMFSVFDMSQPSICPKNETLGPSSRGIVEQYLNYDTEYLNKLDLGKDAMLKASGSSTNATYPVIVTATSSKCVSDMMIWIPEIAKLKLKTRVIVYDIGMTLLQRRKVQETLLPLA